MFSSGFALSILLLGEENKILSLLPSFLYAGMCHIYIYIYVIHIYIYMIHVRIFVKTAQMILFPITFLLYVSSQNPSF